MRERNFFFLSSSKNITDGRERDKKGKNSLLRRRPVVVVVVVSHRRHLYSASTRSIEWQLHIGLVVVPSMSLIFSRATRDDDFFAKNKVKGPKNTRKREEGAVKNASSSTTISNNKESERHDKTYHRHILRLFRSLSMRSAFVYVFVSPFFFWRRRRSQKMILWKVRVPRYTH